MQVVHAVGQHAGRDNEKDAERGPQQRHRGFSGRLHRGPDEEGRFDALATDCHEGDNHEADPGAHEGPVDAAPEVAGQVPSPCQHPEHHPGHQARRHDRQHSADGLLGRERQFVGAVGERGTDTERQQHGEADLGPDARQSVATAERHDIGHENGHDEGGFEAFAQADQIICEHGAS